jgi:imidazoleglycerol phosphate synthase glutamine amidotransferase subunit HisH
LSPQDTPFFWKEKSNMYFVHNYSASKTNGCFFMRKTDYQEVAELFAKDLGSA